MNFWQWLVTPQGIPVLVALVGVLSGIVGALTAQLTAGYFKERGDIRQLGAAKSQFDALQSRWEKEQVFERQKILADDRRALFLKTAHSLQRTREVMKSAPFRQGEGWQVWKDAVTECMDQLFLVETELRILAPELAPGVRQAFRRARSMREADPRTPTSQLNLMTSDYVVDAELVMSEMRKALGTDDATGGTAPLV